jgi:Cu/Ag efflux pump CusA
MGMPVDNAIVTACVSRLGPVVRAATTTILGMAPLLSDVFFASLAATIMTGLGFATVLTLIGVPVPYPTYLRAERRAERVAKPITSVNAAIKPETPPHRLAAE